MKRKGGDGEGTNMVFGMNDARRKASGRIEVEDLCSKLTSLLPQDYRLGASQVRKGYISSQILCKFIVNWHARIHTLGFITARKLCTSVIAPTFPLMVHVFFGIYF